MRCLPLGVTQVSSNKYASRIAVVTALRALASDVVAALVTLFDKTPTAKRSAAVKAFNRTLWGTCVDVHNGSIDNAMRQLRFHVATLPYVNAAGHAYAIDGGAKRGQVTLVTAVDEIARTFAVVIAVDGNVGSTRTVATFDGTLAFDRCKACYRATREGQPYVVKAKGKFAVSDNGAHVNAALVSVTNAQAALSRKRTTFDVYRASGAGKPGKGTARKVNNQ